MENRYFRKFALAIFLDREGNTIIQDRRAISKSGEKYGLFGGGIESGETPEEGLKRELKEELSLDVVIPHIWQKWEYNVSNHGLGLFHYYLLPLPKNIETIKVSEGGIIKTTVKEFLKFEGLDEEDIRIYTKVLEDWDNVVKFIQ